MQPLAVDWIGALLGGLVGVLLMTLFWYTERAAGWMKLDWGQLLGTFFWPPGKRALATGLALHFLAGLLFGLLYAWVLVKLGLAPNWRNGLTLGVIHGALAVALLFPLTRVHPWLPSRDATRIWSKRDMLLFGLGFVLYGLSFGATYSNYPHWVSAAGMDPARFWLTAYMLLAVAVVVGIGAYILIPRWREEQSPVFSAVMPTVRERQQALHREYEMGELTRDELERALADLEREEGV